MSGVYTRTIIGTEAYQLTFAGLWNATTNTPTLTSGVGVAGTLYRVSVAGSTSLDGISSWAIDDDLYFDGSVWLKIDNSGGGGGGGEDLAATLVLGNITGGTDLQISKADVIRGYQDPMWSNPTDGASIIFGFGLPAGAGSVGAIEVEDGSTSLASGSKRGAFAVDFQAHRGIAPMVASGTRSFIAAGQNNTASGDDSFSTGVGAQASGGAAFATGLATSAVGNYSFVGGYYCEANGHRSMALGSYNTAGGYADMVFGKDNVSVVPVSSNYSYAFVEGGSNYSRTNYGAHVEGFTNRVEDHADYDVNGLYARGSHCEGTSNRVYGRYSHMEGQNNVSWAFYGHTEGQGNLNGDISASALGGVYKFAAAWDAYRVASERPYYASGWDNAQATHMTGMDNSAAAPVSTLGGRRGVSTVPLSWVRGAGQPLVASRYGEGAAQTSILTLTGETNGAVTLDLFTLAPGTPRYLVVRQNTAQAFRVRVVAVADTSTSTGIAEAASWEFTGLVRRNKYTMAGTEDGGTGSITVTGAPLPSPGDTITIGGPLGGSVVLTAVAGARTPGGGDFSLASGTVAGIALDLSRAIGDIRNGIRFLHVAENDSVVGVFNITNAYPLGVSGNSVSLATSNAPAFTLSGATLTGGVDSVITLVGASAVGPAAPLYADAGAVSWTAEVKIDATKQSLDIEVVGQAGKRIAWEATIYTSEVGRRLSDI